MALPLLRIWNFQLSLLRYSHIVKKCIDLPVQTLVPAASLSLSKSLCNNRDQTTDDTVDIVENPFFQKYKQKIQDMQSANPEEFSERLRDLAESRKRKVKPKQVDSKDQQKPLEVTPPSEVARDGAGMTRPKGLDSVLKMELIQDKSAEEIKQIWNQYHSGKDMLYAVLTNSEYENLLQKSRECPVFVFPIPRDDGFEFILAQFDQHDVYFTPLAIFQLVRENAPPCLTVNHFTELMDDKGIVLMNGQYDPKVLSQTLALNLVQQMSIFYGKDSKFYDLVHKFNYEPETFKYEELLDALKTLPQHDMK